VYVQVQFQLLAVIYSQNNAPDFRFATKTVACCTAYEKAHDRKFTINAAGFLQGCPKRHSENSSDSNLNPQRHLSYAADSRAENKFNIGKT